MHAYLKFPTTPHLALLDGVSVRNDKVLSLRERDFFLTQVVTVEEKIDGANLGISFDSEGNILVQNRGDYLQAPMNGQWKKLTMWLNLRSDSLFDVLADRYVLFGEWCYARHTVFYDQLPDWFIGFDVFDTQSGRFLSKETRDGFLSSLKLPVVPCVARGRFTLAKITGLLGQSTFGQEPVEGLYLRFNDGDWLCQRAKLVRPDFTQSLKQHWSHKPIEINRLESSVSID